MNPAVARLDDARQEDAHEDPQLLLRRPSFARLLNLLRRPVHRPDRGLDDLLVEAVLAAEVIVDRGDVGAGGFADLADGDLGEATLGEESCRALDQPLAGLAFAIVHC